MNRMIPNEQTEHVGWNDGVTQYMDKTWKNNNLKRDSATGTARFVTGDKEWIRYRLVFRWFHDYFITSIVSMTANPWSTIL